VQHLQQREVAHRPGDRDDRGLGARWHAGGRPRQRPGDAPAAIWPHRGHHHPGHGCRVHRAGRGRLSMLRRRSRPRDHEVHDRVSGESGCEPGGPPRAAVHAGRHRRGRRGCSPR
jgi:hypothetical protein